jgi:hypothetical protein
VSNDRDLTAVTRAMADIEPGLRLHFVTAGQGARTIVLLLPADLMAMAPRALLIPVNGHVVSSVPWAVMGQLLPVAITLTPVPASVVRQTHLGLGWGAESSVPG